MIKIVAGDALEAIPRLVDEGVVVDSVVTDPPYHLTARTSRFGKEGSAPPQYGKDGAMGRLSKGFMGQQWDGGDIAFRPETWATIATIMRPGAFLLCFGGTRTYHRVTSAIEDGGLIIQDCIMWLYGTGFPKRRDMLKPAFEPICVAYKPGGDRTMQIDECRISIEETGGNLRRAGMDFPSNNGTRNNAIYGEDNSKRGGYYNGAGRWPANICHDGSDEVVSMFPKSDSTRANGNPNNPKRGANHVATSYGQGDDTETVDHRDTGSAARFFYNMRDGEASAEKRYTEEGSTDFTMKPGERRHDEGSAARFFWSPKANKTDRAGSRHPTVKPVSLMSWLVPLVTPVGGLVLDPFAGSGTTGAAAEETGRDAILIERESEYIADLRRRFPTTESALRELTAAIRAMTASYEMPL